MAASATRCRAWAPPEAVVEDAEGSEDEEDKEEEPCGEDEVPDFEAKVESLERELAAALPPRTFIPTHEMVIFVVPS